MGCAKNHLKAEWNMVDRADTGDNQNHGDQLIKFIQYSKCSSQFFYYEWREKFRASML